MYVKEKSRMVSLGIYLIWAAIFLLGIYALLKYPGQAYIYILFSVVSNTLLYFGFRKNAFFFDTFIGIFFWLGFWLKLTLRVGFMDGLINQGVSYFDGSGAAFDRALLVSSCGMMGLLVASYIREKWVFNYPQKVEGVDQLGLYNFYLKYRKLVLAAFVTLFVAVAASNAYFGIYQRGEIPKTILPFGLGGIYTWLLSFGLASIAAMILRFEFTRQKRTSYLVVILSLLENFVSNVSLLSRGMLLNSSALFFGIFRSVKTYSITSGWRFLVVSFFAFFILFAGSVQFVNHLRSNLYLDTNDVHDVKGMKTPTPLFIDRWVGIEGVTAVSSYPDLGWKLWNEAWKEKFSFNKTSFYDLNLIVSSYKDTDMTKHHFISLPGIIAFFYYPGSYLFLFVCMIALGCFAAAIELSVFKFGGSNLILCALLAQVVAFRFASFGYVPSQSYLLFGTIFLNLAVIYFADKFLLRINKSGAVVSKHLVSD